MTRIGLLAGTLAIVASSTHVFAQADIASLVSKTQFTKDDIARIATFVDEAARKFGLAKTEKDRVNVVAGLRKFTDDPKATPQFKSALGIEYARAFENFFTAPEFPTAFGSVLLLDRVGSPAIRDKLVTIVTSSPHAAVRYIAIKGLRSILATVKDAKDSEAIVDVLGQQGASEPDPVVLSLIYDTLLSAASRDDFPAQDQIARALVAIFDARAGAGRAVSEAAGFAAAAAAYPGIKNDTQLQNKLVLSLARHLAFFVRRYAQLGPAGGGVRLKDGAKSCEDALIKIVQSAGGSPPSAGQRVAPKISAGAPVKDVQDSLAAWIGATGKPGVLNGAPWKLAIGLSQ